MGFWQKAKDYFLLSPEDRERAKNAADGTATYTLDELRTLLGKKASGIELKRLAIDIVVSYVAEALSKCDIRVFEKGAEAPLSDTAYRLNVSPNPNQNASEFWSAAASRLLKEGSALIVSEGKKMYLADSFAVQQNGLAENIYSGITVNGRSVDKSYPASSVVYLKLDEDSMGSSIAGFYKYYSDMLSTAASMFKQANSKRYKLQIDGFEAGDAEFQDIYRKHIVQDIQAFLDADVAVYPEFRGYKLIDMGVAESSRANAAKSVSDVLDLREEVFKIMALAFKIPMAMMTGALTSQKEIVETFLTFGIDPFAELIAKELTRKTFTQAQWAAGSKIVFDTQTIRHIDIFEIAANADKLVASGAMSINEVRERLGLEPKEGEFFEDHWMTKNYSPQSLALTPEALDTRSGTTFYTETTEINDYEDQI